MPFQHIFTSAQIGLHPGSSGYCTVAQTEGIPGDLIKALEGLSTYDFSAKNDPDMGGHSPVIYRYQFVRVHSGTYFVVSKINDAGADYTGRTNYLAQHLAFDSSEVSQLQAEPRLNPATLLLVGTRWKESWDEMPQKLSQLDMNDLFPGKHDVLYLEDTGCSTWMNGRLGTKGDQAPTLLEPPYNTKCFLHLPPGEEKELLHLLHETLWVSGKETWHHTFTTFLQQGENHEDYAWCGVSGGNAQQQAAAAGQTLWSLQALPKSGNPPLIYKALMGREQVPEPAPTVPAPKDITETQVPETQQSAQSQTTPKTQPPEVTAPVTYPETTSAPTYNELTERLEACNRFKELERQNAREECFRIFKREHEKYVKYVRSQVDGSSDEESIESKQEEIAFVMAELLAHTKELNTGQTKQILLNIRTDIYDPLDEYIEKKLKGVVQPEEAPDSAPEEAPGSVPAPTEIGIPKKRLLEKRKLEFMVVALAIFAIIGFALLNKDKLKQQLDEWKKERANVFEQDQKIENDENGKGESGKKGENGKGESGKKGENGKGESGKNGKTNPGGDNNTNPSNPKELPSNLKAQIDKYFGGEKPRVRFINATEKGEVELKGYQAPILFETLSKLPEGTNAESLIKVYQPKSKDDAFEKLEWQPIDPKGNATTKDGLQLLNKRKDDRSIIVSNIPKRADFLGLDLPNNPSPENKVEHLKAKSEFYTKKFIIKPHQNTAIRTETSTGDEIIYILVNPADAFFDGVFDHNLLFKKVRGAGNMSPKIRIHPYLSKALSRVYLGGMDQNKLIEMATSSEVWATPEKEKATRMEFKSNEKGWQEWGPEVASWEKVLAGLKQLNDSNGKPRKLDFKFYKKLPGIGDNIWFNSEIGKDAPVNIDEGAVLLVKPVDGEKIKIEGVYFGPTANSWKFSNKNKDAKVEVKKSFGLAQNIGLPNYKQIYVYIAERPKKLQLEIRLILSQEQLGKLRNAIEQTQKKLNDLKKNQNNLVRTSVGFIYYKSRQPVIKFNVE